MQLRNAHIYQLKNSTFYKIAGCSGSELQLDQDIKDSNDQFFRNLQNKRNANTLKSVKRGRCTSFSLQHNVNRLLVPTVMIVLYIFLMK